VEVLLVGELVILHLNVGLSLMLLVFNILFLILEIMLGILKQVLFILKQIDLNGMLLVQIELHLQLIYLQINGIIVFLKDIMVQLQFIKMELQ